MSKKTFFIVLFLILPFTLTFNYAFSDDDDHEQGLGHHDDDHRDRKFSSRRSGLRNDDEEGTLSNSRMRFGDSYPDTRGNGSQSAANTLYKDECGSCHFAYPASLLPQVSWRKLMSGLDDHFGDNAEIDNTENRNQLLDFLVSQASGRNFNGNVPIRITELRYFVREHDEIPSRLVKNNPKVNSLANCEACHTKASQGTFSEYDVVIAGYGPWDD